MTPNDYTLDDLVRLTGFSKRQIRFYITKRLVAGAGDRGPNAGYGEETLRRLRLVAAMKDIPIAPTGRTMTLDEIGHALDSLDEDGINSILEGRAELALIDTDESAPVVKSPRLLSGPPKLPAPGDSAVEFLARMREPGLRVKEPFVSPYSEKCGSPAHFDKVAREPLGLAASHFSRNLTGGEEQDTIHDLLGRLQASLAELGSDTRFTNTAKEGEQWLRITTPDVEFHVRKPDDHRARRRLIQMAQHLGRLLAREE